jgi:hypothetical protein
MSSSIKYADEVGEKCLPDPEFKFMQQIDHKHTGRIKLASKALDESILVDNNELLSTRMTMVASIVGTPEKLFNRSSTALPPIGFASS